MSTKKINSFLSDLNADSVREFINKHLVQLIYLLSFIIIIIFVCVYIISRKNEKVKNLMISYYQAIDYLRNDNPEEGLDLLEGVFESKYADEDIKTISGIKIAEIFNETERKDEAAKMYKEVYNMKNNNDFLKNLSGLAALNILINENNPEKYGEIEQLINNLSSPSNPLILLVNEQEGIFEIQRGNKAKGLEILNNILLNDNIDEDTKTRVESVIEAYANENL